MKTNGNLNVLAGVTNQRIVYGEEKGEDLGVSKLSYMWLIPKDAKKPIDGRMKVKTNRRTIMEFNEKQQQPELGKI